MSKDETQQTRGAGRPRKDLSDKDWEQFLGMIRIQCTRDEICSVFGMDDETLSRNIRERGYPDFSTVYKQHSGEGKSSLRRLQYKSAQEGNVTMQIWLGKQWLGQRDSQAVEHGGSVNLAVEFIDHADAETDH